MPARVMKKRRVTRRVPRKVTRTSKTPVRRKYVRKTRVIRAVGTTMRNKSYTMLADGWWTGAGIGMTMGKLYASNWLYPPVAERVDPFYVHIKSLMVDRTFYYDGLSGGGADIGPIRVKWMLVQAKNRPGSPSPLATTLSAESRIEFWERRTNVGSQTYDTWLDTTAADGAVGWQSRYLDGVINGDGYFRVLATRSRTLCPRSTESETSGKHRWRMKKTYAVNKRFAYSNTSNISPDDQIYELFWFYPTSPVLFPTVNPAAVEYCRFSKTNALIYKKC